MCPRVGWWSPYEREEERRLHHQPSTRLMSHLLSHLFLINIKKKIGRQEASLHYYFYLWSGSTLRWPDQEVEDNRRDVNRPRKEIVGLATPTLVLNPTSPLAVYQITVSWAQVCIKSWAYMSVIWHLFNLWKQHVIENEFSNPTCEVSTGKRCPQVLICLFYFKVKKTNMTWDSPALFLWFPNTFSL